jgi:hypothetical protein
MRSSHLISWLEVAPHHFLDGEGKFVSKHRREGSAHGPIHDFVECSREHMLMARPSRWNLFVLRTTWTSNGTTTRKRPGTGIDINPVRGGNFLGKRCKGEKKEGEGKVE